MAISLKNRKVQKMQRLFILIFYCKCGRNKPISSQYLTLFGVDLKMKKIPVTSILNKLYYTVISNIRNCLNIIDPLESQGGTSLSYLIG